MVGDDRHLSEISTLWSVVRRAHGPDGESVRPAQEMLVERYGGAIQRYLLGALRDAAAAEELYQDFSLKFLRGDFQNADPGRGRFRSFVKSVLFRMIVDHHRAQKRGRRVQPLADGVADGEAQTPLEAQDEAFRRSWREELLARAWRSLEEHEQRTGQIYFTVLRFRADHPELRSPAMAGELGRRLGRTISAQGVRQTLHRARQEFSRHLLEEVAQSLEDARRACLEEELIELDLLEYCRPALDRLS